MKAYWPASLLTNQPIAFDNNWQSLDASEYTTNLPQIYAHDGTVTRVLLPSVIAWKQNHEFPIGMTMNCL